MHGQGKEAECLSCQGGKRRQGQLVCTTPSTAVAIDTRRNGSERDKFQVSSGLVTSHAARLSSSETRHHKERDLLLGQQGRDGGGREGVEWTATPVHTRLSAPPISTPPISTPPFSTPPA